MRFKDWNVFHPVSFLASGDYQQQKKSESRLIHSFDKNTRAQTDKTDRRYLVLSAM